GASESAAPAFDAAELPDFIALGDNPVAPLGVGGIDAVQRHAETVLKHGAGVVAEAAKRGQLLIDVLVATRVAIADVLDGGCRLLAEDAEAAVPGKTQPAFVLPLIAGVVCAGALRAANATEDRLAHDHVFVLANRETGPGDEASLMHGGNTGVGHGHVVPDFGVRRRFGLGVRGTPFKDAGELLRRLVEVLETRLPWDALECFLQCDALFNVRLAILEDQRRNGRRTGF